MWETTDDKVKRSLSPNQAVSVLEERVKLIGKVNSDIADWLAVSNCSLQVVGLC